MAAGAPVTLSNAVPTASQRGAVLQGTAVAALTVTATTGTLPTANGAITIADAATPTVAELQEFCVELKSRHDALVASLQAAGVLA
jgi:F0F1-type ATP synthase epsilon subunit